MRFKFKGSAADKGLALILLTVPWFVLCNNLWMDDCGEICAPGVVNMDMMGLYCECQHGATTVVPEPEHRLEIEPEVQIWLENAQPGGG